MKSSNLRCSLAHSQNKGLSQCQRKAIRLWRGPSPSQRQRGRWATARAGRQGAISTPEMASSAKLWAGSQLLTKSSWDPGWLTLSRRGAAWYQLTEEIHSTPEMALLWHTWETEWLGPRRWLRCTVHLGQCACQAPGCLSCSDLRRTQNSHPTKSVPLWSTQELEPEQLRSGKCTKCWSSFGHYPCRETWSLSRESTCRCELGQTQCGP